MVSEAERIQISWPFRPPAEHSKSRFLLWNLSNKALVKRFLKAADVKIVDGGSHLKLYYKGRQSTCPQHPSHEISNAFAKKIKKQLGVN